MNHHASRYSCDDEIISTAHESQATAAGLGEQRFGVLADATDVLKYRLYDWGERRSAIRPIHKMTHLYREDPSLARELAVLAHAQSALTNMTSIAVLLRGGILPPVPAVFRVAHELFIDANFLCLDESGKNAVRMLDWQLAATAKINPDDLDMQEIYEKMKAEYGRDEDFGSSGAWAILPNGKSARSFGARMQHVYAAIEKGVPDHVLSEEDWRFLRNMIGEQRAQANATMHASPIAAATVDDQNFMATQAAMFDFQTVAVHRRVSDEWLDKNREAILLELGRLPLEEDDLAWGILGTAVHRFSLAVRQTFDVGGEADSDLP